MNVNSRQHGKIYLPREDKKGIKRRISFVDIKIEYHFPFTFSTFTRPDNKPPADDDYDGQKRTFYDTVKEIIKLIKNKFRSSTKATRELCHSFSFHFVDCLVEGGLGGGGMEHEAM